MEKSVMRIVCTKEELKAAEAAAEAAGDYRLQ